MKKILILIIILFLFLSCDMIQVPEIEIIKAYITPNRYEADFTGYIVEYKSEADAVIRIVDRYSAEKKIYLTGRYIADKKLYIQNY